MKSIYSELALFMIVCAQVTPIPAQESVDWPSSLTDIHFITKDSGWVVGDSGFIAASVDGGDTWNQQETTVSLTLRKLSFLNSRTGWVAGDGVVLGTTNGGISWQELSYFDNTDQIDIEFASESIGVMSDGVNVFKSENGGIDWQVIGVSYSGIITSLEVLDTNNIWYASGITMLQSMDRGDSFTLYEITAHADPSKWKIDDIAIFDDSTGWAIGTTCGLLDPENPVCGPTIWLPVSWYVFFGFEEVSFPSGQLLHATQIVDSLTGWAVGDSGQIIKTVDSGRTWLKQESNVYNNLFALSFVDTLTGWIVGDQNLIIKTQDGGENWSVVVGIDEPYREILPSGFHLSQNSPNPFNPSTTIEYTLPKSGFVSLIVYNLLGQEVARLVNGEFDAGNHKVRWDASDMASGVYLYRLQTGDFVKTRKMVLLR